MVARAGAQTTDNESLDEVDKEPSNLTSSIRALRLQENAYWLNKPERNVVNLQFQPVLATDGESEPGRISSSTLTRTKAVTWSPFPSA